jgi:PAS domain S-box-containing protein
LFDLQRIKRAASEEVLHQMPAAVIVAEATSGKIILRNRPAQQIREQSSSRARATNLEDATDFEIFHPDGRPYEIEEWPLMRSIRDGEEVRDEEFIYPLADGSRLWLRCDSTPIYDEEERLVAGVMVAHDITEQKRSEEQLAYHAHLLENIHDAVTATDERYIITAWNKGAEQMFGWTADEALGRRVYELIPTDYRDEQLEEALRELTETGRRRSEGLRYRKDGTPVYAEALTIALRGEQGEITGYLGIHWDITERKRAEEEIEAQAYQQAAIAELGLRALANNDLQSLMDDIVIFIARTLGVEYSKIVELLPGGEELLLRAATGLEEELVGSATESAGLDTQAGYTLLSDEPVIVEDIRTETRFRPPPLVQERGAVSGMSVVILGRDGPFGVLGAHTTNRRSFLEDDVNFLQVVANVLAAAIEREEAEERVEEGRESERSRLARELHDGTLQDLTDALVQAQQIQSFSEDSQQTLRLVRLIATLDRIGPQLRGAVYDLRLEGEKEKLFPELLEALVELHRSMAPESDIAVEVGNGVLLEPLGERGRQLLRILGEALTNVRRHSGAQHVHVGVGMSEEKLWAEVEDDGRGFDVAQQEEDSEQAAAAASGGLGIRGMRERAHALGGELKIESEPGKRTKVRFEMALKPENEQPEEEVRILLVEDYAIFREALASYLKREMAGFEVVGEARSLAETRRMLQQEEQQQVDVAVIDLGLPDGYGGDLIKDLREAYPQAQALVLSATLERAQIARAVEAGAAGVINKTAHLSEVVDAVKRLRRGETLLPLEEVVELLRFAGRRRDEEHEAHQAIDQLTPREREVLQALAEGLDSEQIAQRLHISLRTERNHIANILSKLGVHSQLQALVFALRYGVAEIP